MIIVKKTILKGTKYQFGGNKKKYPTNAAKVEAQRLNNLQNTWEQKKRILISEVMVRI